MVIMQTIKIFVSRFLFEFFKYIKQYKWIILKINACGPGDKAAIALATSSRTSLPSVSIIPGVSTILIRLPDDNVPIVYDSKNTCLK
jgi:hypothetical protein